MPFYKVIGLSLVVMVILAVMFVRDVFGIEE
jgi:hypothetical protein